MSKPWITFLLSVTEHNPNWHLTPWPRKANRLLINDGNSHVNPAQSAQKTEWTALLWMGMGWGLLESNNWSGRLSKRTEHMSWVLENQPWRKNSIPGQGDTFPNTRKVSWHDHGAKMTSSAWGRGHMWDKVGSNLGEGRIQVTKKFVRSWASLEPFTPSYRGVYPEEKRAVNMDCHAANTCRTLAGGSGSLAGHEVSMGSAVPPSPASLSFIPHGVFQGLCWHFSVSTKWWLRMNRSVDNCLLRRQPLVWQIRVGCWIVQYSWARQLGNSTYHCAGQLIHFLSHHARQGITDPQSIQARKSVYASDSAPNALECSLQHPLYFIYLSCKNTTLYWDYSYFEFT